MILTHPPLASFQTTVSISKSGELIFLILSFAIINLRILDHLQNYENVKNSPFDMRGQYIK